MEKLNKTTQPNTPVEVINEKGLFLGLTEFDKETFAIVLFSGDIHPTMVNVCDVWNY